MPTDVRDLLRGAAVRPDERPDFEEIWETGRRRRFTVRAAGLAAAAAIVVLAAVGIADLVGLTGDPREVLIGQPGEIAALEDADDRPSEVARRDVDGVGAVLTVEPDGDVCLRLILTDSDSRGCTADHRGQIDRDGLALRMVSVDGSDQVFGAVVPDHFDRAYAPDGRSWEIEHNLLVIVVSPDPDTSIDERPSLPATIRLEGPAGIRDVSLTDLVDTTAGAGDAPCLRRADEQTPHITQDDAGLRVELYADGETTTTCVWDILREPPVPVATFSGTHTPLGPDDVLDVRTLRAGVVAGPPPGALGYVTVLTGRVAEQVAAVTVTREDGQEFRATINDGHFAAWWEHPDGLRPEHIVAEDHNGQTIHEQPIDNEPPPTDTQP